MLTIIFSHSDHRVGRISLYCLLPEGCWFGALEIMFANAELAELKYEVTGSGADVAIKICPRGICSQEEKEVE